MVSAMALPRLLLWLAMVSVTSLPWNLLWCHGFGHVPAMVCVCIHYCSLLADLGLAFSRSAASMGAWCSDKRYSDASLPWLHPHIANLPRSLHVARPWQTSQASENPDFGNGVVCKNKNSVNAAAHVGSHV